jgi:hypothetical protein
MSSATGVRCCPYENRVIRNSPVMLSYEISVIRGAAIPVATKLRCGRMAIGKTPCWRVEHYAWL